MPADFLENALIDSGDGAETARASVGVPQKQSVGRSNDEALLAWLADSLAGASTGSAANIEEATSIPAEGDAWNGEIEPFDLAFAGLGAGL